MSEELQIELEALESILLDDEKIKVEPVEGGLSLEVDVRIQGMAEPTVLRVGEVHVSVEHLPPVHLSVFLDQEYPAGRPPRFEVGCVWLSRAQLYGVCRGLDEESEAMGEGSCVLLPWVAWIQTQSTAALGLGGDVEVLEAVRLANSDAAERLFASRLHCCGVCFDQVPGAKALRLFACSHVFCKQCLRGLCSVQIKEGSVHLVKCPEFGCGEGLSQADVRNLVEPEEFERYERVSVGRVLDTMSDLHWCPRCQSPCLMEDEKEDAFARCPICMYSFCTVCRGSWHPGAPCTHIDDASLRGLRAELKSLKDSKGARGKKEEARMRFLQGHIDTLMSEKAIIASTKKCPNCKSSIEKDGGCNKMTCGKCGKYFCWLCNRIIDGYQHYQRGRCAGQLFPEGAENDDYIPDDVGGGGGGGQWGVGQGARGTNCPSCGMLHVKEPGDSNYVFCPCMCEFCFLCHALCRMETAVGEEELGVREHFRQIRGRCKEFTSEEEERLGRTAWE